MAQGGFNQVFWSHAAVLKSIALCSRMDLLLDRKVLGESQGLLQKLIVVPFKAWISDLQARSSGSDPALHFPAFCGFPSTLPFHKYANANVAFAEMSPKKKTEGRCRDLEVPVGNVKGIQNRREDASQTQPCNFLHKTMNIIFQNTLLSRTSEATLGILRTVLGQHSLTKMDAKALDSVQRRATQMIKGLEAKSCDKQLRELDMTNLSKRRIKG